MKSGFLKISLPLITGFLLILFAAFNFNGNVLATQPSKVTICHAAGQADTTHFETLTISWNAVYGQAGHFYENGTPRAGHEQDYLGPCTSPSPSPSPSYNPSPSPTPHDDCDENRSHNDEDDDCDNEPTPTPSPSVSPSPSPTPPVFPDCQDQNGQGDRAHYTNGTHWVVGDGILIGSDDVYSIGNQNYLQCYCPLVSEYVSGDEGIQTDWESAHTVNKPAERSGYFLVWGPDFGLDQSWYWATGADKPTPTTPNFDCGEPTPTPSSSVSPSPTPNDCEGVSCNTGGTSPTPSPTPSVSPSPESTPSASPSTGGSSSSDGGSNNSNENSSGGGSVLGTSTGPQVLASTGISNLYILSILGFGMITTGLWLLKRSLRLFRVQG